MVSSNSKAEPSQEVPIFLRKTYHMIDSCDPEVACWSDDGETFVVKDPVKFERTIIPQFFKHSKFSSFVRQLNFYSFRKIKYADTIRIDAKLEAETANYWRFRHEKFQRGKPELLIEIKRMNGQKSATTTTTTTTNSNAPKPVVKEEKSANSEVQTLRKKIEEMSKNIDQLTAMVQKVSLKQEQHEGDLSQSLPGNKRKKLEVADDIRPDDMLSSMELDEAVLPPIASMPLPMPMDRDVSVGSSEVSDNEFVDQLFTAFKDDDDDLFQLGSPALPAEPEKEKEDTNRPDPELMKRLGDALMLLPRETQEMIVDRLIAAITSAEPIVTIDPKKVVPCGKAVPDEIPPTPDVDTTEVAIPLAAATMSALLKYYSQAIKGKSQKDMPKCIPVIPVHA